MKKVTIYTDGACSGNPGPGGWGCILIYGERRLEKSGYDPETTNNRMELTAAIEGLKTLKEPCEAEVYTDSAYLFNAFEQGWIIKWMRNGWKTAAKTPVENQDLWNELLSLGRTHTVHYHKVKGHADNPLNNRCDQLATGEIRRRNNAN
ncbi:MAG: ribonuclease HI [Clostridiales bacterium]|nr:ribonuclease HI [Clostridiales bacterium]